MTDEVDYDEVEAFVRIPKGGRLADSKKTEGLFRGFTPNSADKGMEHVEIRLKDKSDGNDSVEPEVVYFHDFGMRPRQKTPEQEELEKLAGELIALGFVKAVEWAHPRLERLWADRVVPYLSRRKLRRQDRNAQRKVSRHVTAASSESVLRGTSSEGSNEVTDALEVYEANMTSAEARRHFTEALIAQRFVDEKMRLLAEARIEDDAPPSELANAVKALTPKQVEIALISILRSNPAIMNDIGRLIAAVPHDGGTLMGGGQMKEVPPLIDGR
ncbi:hypothetical protein [Arthrobacter psychrolactophilus]